MRKIHSLLAAALTLCLTANALPVEKGKAVENANTFLSQRGTTQVDEANVRTVSVSGTPFYVINIPGNKGFLIMGGDDRSEEVLAYADSGAADLSRPDSPLSFLLNYWSGQIQTAPERQETSGEEETASPRHAMSLAHEPVAPFVTRRWEQGAPFNLEMPRDAVEPGRPVPAGCLTTAMAMALSVYPDAIGTTKTIPDYSWDEETANGTVHQTYGGDYAPIMVDGALFSDVYYTSGASKDDAANAQVASLCRAVAQATKAQFSTANTLTLERDVTPAFQYFNFEQPQEVILSQISFADNYHEMLYNELSHRRPVLMVGKVNSPGKDERRNRDAMSFVIDGYDRGDYYHVNWGEKGLNNGYYKLCAIRLREGCGTYDHNGYFPTCKLMAWVGIQPKTGNHVKADFYEVEDMSLQYTGLSFKDKTIRVTLCNYFPTEQTFEHGLGVYDAQYNLQAVIAATESVFPAGTYTEVAANAVTGSSRVGNERFTFAYTVGSLPKDALLIPVSRVKGCDIWHSSQCAARNASLRVNALGGFDAVKRLTVEDFSLVNPAWQSGANQARTLVSKITNHSLDRVTVALNLCFADDYEGDENGGDRSFRRIQYLDGDYTYLYSDDEGVYWDVYPDNHFSSFDEAYAWAEDGKHTLSYWDVYEQKSVSIPKNSTLTIHWDIATMPSEKDSWGHYAKDRGFALAVYTDTLAKTIVPVTRGLDENRFYPTNMFTYEILDVTPAQLYNAGTAKKPSWRAGVFGDDFHVKFRLTNTSEETFDGYVLLSDRYAKVLIAPGASQDFYFSLNERELSNVKSTTTTAGYLKVSYNRLKTPVYNADARWTTIFEYVDPVSNDESIGKTYRGKVYVNPDKGIRYWTVDGEMRGVAPASEFVVPADAVAVSTALLTEDCAVTPNANPNTLYYVRSYQSALDGKNVVIIDGEVTNAAADGLGIATGRAYADITLTDGYGIYVPYAFSLDGNHISYSREISKSFDGNPEKPNWEGIVLPFTPTRIMSGERNLDWFREQGETDKDLWVARYHGEDAYTVYFKYAQAMKPYVPYLITVPGKTVSKTGGLVGKKITFTADGDYVVPAAPKNIFSASRELSFEGTLSGKTVSPKDESIFYLNETNIFDNHYDYYFLNQDGSAFAFNNGGVSVSPFHAWFSSRGNQLTEIPTLRIVLNGMARNIADPSGITEVKEEQEGETVSVYTLEGVKVATCDRTDIRRTLQSLPKGIYVAGGRKYMR